MQIEHFRNHLLQALKHASESLIGSRIHLLYVPGFGNPLGLSAANPRKEAIVHSMVRAGFDRAMVPRVIELDCRKVASFLLETHPGFDDPLLESSITHAYGYTQSQADEERLEPMGRHVAGWIVSKDDVTEIARRLGACGKTFRPPFAGGSHVDWHDPRLLAQLWPSLGSAQRHLILGTDSVWIAVDAQGCLVHFSHDDRAPAPDGTDSNATITLHQASRIQHVELVNHLLESWREQCAARRESLPAQATERLHEHVDKARRAGLDACDLQSYVLFAVSAREGFEEDSALRAALSSAKEAPGTLADHLSQLPSEFWERYRAT